MQKEELLFENLFKKALSEWPASLDLELQTQKFDEVIPTDKGYDLVRYKNLPWNKKLENYIVKDLYRIYEAVEDKYIAQPNEVLMRNLHMVIYYTLRELAKCLQFVQMKDLRAELVEEEFNNTLKEYLNDKDERSWGVAAIQLIEDYFAVNYPEDYEQKA